MNEINTLIQLRDIFKKVDAKYEDEKELKPLFQKVDSEYEDEKELKPLFQKVDVEYKDEKELKPLFQKINLRENDSTFNPNQLESTDTIEENIYTGLEIKSEKIDMIKILNNTTSIIEKGILPNNETLDKKVLKSFYGKDTIEKIKEDKVTENKKEKIIQKLYRYIIKLDIIRTIDGSLYRYSKYSHLERINRSNEELEINSLINKIDRISLEPRVITDLVKKIKQDPDLVIKYEELNRNNNLINVKNGVVDIQTGNIYSHNRYYNFDYVINANYIPYENYKLSAFDKFVNTSLEGNSEKITILLEIMGYLVSGYTSAKKAFFLVGVPHSGKSMISRVITYMIGEGNVSNVPLQRMHEKFLLSELSSHKVNIAAEIGSSDLKNIEVFKSIVGNDALVAEFKNKDPFKFKPTIKLLFCGNQLPSIYDSEATSAFMDRLTFLIFSNSVPEHERDLNLEEKIIREIDGIFTESVFALMKLRERNFIFTQTNDEFDVLTEYKNSQNHISDFVEEYCIINKNNNVYVEEIKNAYENYCYKNLLTPYKQDKFNNYILNINSGIVKKKFRKNGQNKWGYIGIGLK